MPTALLCLTVAFPGADAFWLDTTGLDYERQVTALCLQGIANRDAPRLFLDTAPIYWQWPPSDRHWREYLEKTKGFRFTDLAGLPDAVAKFRDALAGLAVYDPAECDAERALACVYASTESCLPVSAAVLAADAAAFAGLAVRQDLRGRFRDVLEAYRWARAKLLPECARGLCYSLGHSFPGTSLGGDPAVHLSLDYVVAERGFVFSLSPEEAQEGPWKAYPEQAAAFAGIVEALGPLTGVWGWSEPEGAFARAVSKAGGYIMCPGPNMSFWRKVPAETRRLPTPPRQVEKPEDKVYLCFQTNEGDTPKILCAFFAGGWLSQERGSAPVAWGVNPLIGDLCPALFEYYAKTASPNDSFFAGVSGAGYCFPDLMPDREAFCRWTEKHCVATNVPTVDVWLAGPAAPLALFEKYRAVAPSVTGFTMLPKPDGMNRWLPDATPVLSSTGGLHYYGGEGGTPERLAARVREVAATLPRPCFIILYGGVGPGIFGIVRDTSKLLGDDYQACTMDDFMALAREAGRFQLAVEPTIVAPDYDSVMAVMTWHGVTGGPTGREPVEGTATAFGTTAIVRSEPGAADDWGGPTECEMRVALTCWPGTPPGRQEVVARSGDLVRRATVTVATEARTVSDFADTDGWVVDSATIVVADSKGHIRCPDGLPFACVHHPVEVDLDRDPVIQILVLDCDGQWALKANDGTLQSDAYLVRDTPATGTFTARLKDLLPKQWTGRKAFNLILFSCGAGKTVTVQRIRLLYLR